MRVLRYVFSLFIIAAACSSAYSQLISPGELSRAHADLEGISNCTQCHILGEKNKFSEKCLACHTELRTRVTAGRGYHASVREKECNVCHKEHHGRKFALIHWEKKSFDHTLTGYRLEGKHQRQECEKCHTPSHIKDAEILKKGGDKLGATFLGLDQNCLSSCHRDEHRGQLGVDCLKCHTFEGWKPPERFSHNDAKFKLTGKHAQIACVKCHTAQQSGDKKFTKFVGLSFQNCTACHTDRHKGRFGSDCQKCHSTEGWQKVNLANSEFDHSMTRYVLKGQHASLACAKCHRFSGTAATKFNGLKFSECRDCHTDVHKGQFTSRAESGKCEGCHTESGFMPSTFTLQHHEQTKFKLTGAHLATPCNACHRKVDVGTAQERVNFHWMEIQCTTCHEDIHKGQFKERVSVGGCESCHQTTAWRAISFQHDEAQFKLSGKHLDVACKRCHSVVDAGTPMERIRYKTTSMECVSCHTDVHFGQFASTESKQVQCERCHTAQGWKQITFVHNRQSRFELTGKHLQLDCNRCHREVQINGTQKTVLYKPVETKCSSCHEDVHQKRVGDN